MLFVLPPRSLKPQAHPNARTMEGGMFFSLERRTDTCKHMEQCAETHLKQEKTLETLGLRAMVYTIARGQLPQQRNSRLQHAPDTLRPLALGPARQTARVWGAVQR